MTLFDIALVEVEVFFVEAGLGWTYLQIHVALEDAFLLPVGRELSHGNARRNAGIAILAMRPIEMIATATKPHLRQVCIDMHIHGLARVEEQGCGLLLRQITARVRLSGIELQSRQLGHDQPSG
ncbi:hypothetical protein D9M73_219610 [compost metagenome]